MNPQLQAWRVPLEDLSAVQWREEYGVTAIFLNDVAAGAIIEIPTGWQPDDAVKRVASGLRHLLQDLWHLDLVRPLLAVCHPGADVGLATLARLRLLPWDDEWHRGDFALRVAGSADDAATLLYTLIGDTMGELDKNARADRVGVPEVREAMQRRLADLQGSEVDAAMRARLPERVLMESLLEALDRAEASGGDPSLVTILNAWFHAAGGEP